MEEVGAKVFNQEALRTMLADHDLNTWFKLERPMNLFWAMSSPGSLKNRYLLRSGASCKYG